MSELKPPEGYRLYTVDASIEGRASIMFVLKDELRKDWHLQGEVLNAAGDDLRQPLFITRTVSGYLESTPDTSAKVDVGKLAELEAEVDRARSKKWHDGYPSHPWDKEWFIAVTTYGDRVVLKALPKEYTYDFTTADDTYIKKEKIKKWMQFPDSNYIAPEALQAPRSDTSAVELVRELAFISKELADDFSEYYDDISNEGERLHTVHAMRKTLTKAEQWLKKVGVL